MFKMVFKYCVASVNFENGIAVVSYRAQKNSRSEFYNEYDMNDENIIWYDTEKEALNNRINPNDCVVWKFFN